MRQNWDFVAENQLFLCDTMQKQADYASSNCTNMPFWFKKGDKRVAKFPRCVIISMVTDVTVL